MMEAPCTSLESVTHLQHVVDARGLEEIQLHGTHDEVKARRFLRCLREQFALHHARAAAYSRSGPRSMNFR